MASPLTTPSPTPSSTTPSPSTPSPGASPDGASSHSASPHGAPGGASDLSLPESGWDLHIGRGSRAETTGWRPALEIHTGDGLIDVAVAGGLDQTLLRGALRGRRAGQPRGRWGTARNSGGWALAWGHLPAGPTPEPDPGRAQVSDAGSGFGSDLRTTSGTARDNDPGNAMGDRPGRVAEGDAGNAPGSEVRDPELRGAEVHDPEVRDPEVHDPEVRDPEVRDPEVRGPDLRDPEVRGPDLHDSEVRGPEVIVEFRTRRTTYRVRATALAGAFWVAEAPGGFRSVAVTTGPRRAAARLRRYRPGR